MFLIEQKEARIGKERCLLSKGPKTLSMDSTNLHKEDTVYFYCIHKDCFRIQRGRVCQMFTKFYDYDTCIFLLMESFICQITKSLMYRTHTHLQIHTTAMECFTRVKLMT